MAARVETCQICFDDFEVITLEDELEEDDLYDSPFQEAFAYENDILYEEELEQLILALHLSTLDLPEVSVKPSEFFMSSSAQPTTTPAPRSSSSSQPPAVNRNLGIRQETTRSSISTSSSSSSSSASATSSSTTFSLNPLTLGFSLECDKTHLYCSDCLKKYLEGKLQSSVWPIVCPHETCKGSIPPAVVESLLGTKSAKWYDLSVERAVKNKVYCPNKDCNRLVDGDDFDFDSEGAKNILNNITCPYCTTPFCAMCLKEPHG
ncbi:hypothetical protein BGZ65_006489, partial [Modicella reniformis]